MARMRRSNVLLGIGAAASHGCGLLERFDHQTWSGLAHLFRLVGTLTPDCTFSRNKMTDRFSFQEFAKELPSPAVAVLREEGFDTLPALLVADASDIQGLPMKQGHKAMVRDRVKGLQEKHRQGPFFTAAGKEAKQDTEPDVPGQSATEQHMSPAMSERQQPKRVFENWPEVRLVLIGKTGNGKSSLGNTLLGRDVFRAEGGLSSDTKKCQWMEAKVGGTTLSVTDTPGLADTKECDEETLREVTKSVCLACPGPHAVILVIRCDRRFTQEEYNAVKTLKNLFGEEALPFLMVVFTGGDDLRVPRDSMYRALQQRLERAPDTLKEVLREIGSAYCVIDNTGLLHERNSRATDVYSVIQAVYKRNKGNYYTNDLVDKYNQLVQSAIDQRVKTGMSREEATKETREAIANGEEPGFFQKMLDVTRKFILPVLSTAIVIGRVAGCQVM